MEDILDQLDDPNEKYFDFASKGVRFLNYLIDLIGYYFFAIFLGVLYGLLSINDVAFEEAFLEPTLLDRFVDSMISLLLLVIYYTLMEYALKGKTIGKLLTKSRAVTQSNERLDFKTALIRSLGRVIPFEPFSFLGSRPDSGWHDQISKTKVIMDQGWVDLGPDRF